MHTTRRDRRSRSDRRSGLRTSWGGERLLFGRTLKDEDLLIFGSIGERGRKPVKDMTREILVIGDQTWPEQSSLGNGVLMSLQALYAQNSRI